MDENELRATLAGAVPDVPGVPERAGRARARSRRNRRRVLAGAAAAVVVAVAVPAAVLSTGDERATKPLREDEQGRFDCPPGGTKDDPGPMDADAVRIRLCAPDSYRAVQVPSDSLGGARAAALATWVSELPEPKPVRVCDAMLSPTYGFLFGYADGSTRYVTSNAGGCTGATVTGRAADELLTRFKDGLLDQRAELGEPVERFVPPLTGDVCDPGNGAGGAGFSILPPDPRDLRPTVLCVPRGQLSQQDTELVRLEPEDAEVLAADLRNGLITDQELERRHPLRCTLDGTAPPYLIAWNRWGDRFELRRNECNPAFAVYFNWPYGGARYWDPGPAARAVIDAVFVQGDMPLDLPTASTPPDEVVALWIDLEDLADARAADLWPQGRPSFPDGTYVTGKVTALRRDGNTAEADFLFSAEPEKDRPVYRNKTFHLVRDSGTEPWRIESWADQGPE